MSALRDIQSELSERILPALKLTSTDIRALMLYGSRSNGLHRPDSDYDLLVITDIFPAGAAEYHGFIRVQGETYPVELRVFSETTLRQQLHEGPVHRAFAVDSGISLVDPHGILARITPEARSRLARERTQLRKEIAEIEPGEYLNLLRIAFSEARAILLDQAMNPQPLAAFSRFCETLTDYYLSCERLSIRRGSTNLSDAELHKRLQSMLLLSGHRPARFMDMRRQALRPWFNELLHRLNADLAYADHPPATRWVRIFDHLDQNFLEQFGSPLLVSRPEVCEALLKEES